MGRRLLSRPGWRVNVIVVVVALIGGYVAFVATRKHETAGTPPGCHVSLDAKTYTLDLDQMANATTRARQ